MNFDIIAIPAFNDNYIWTMVNNENASAVCVDPGEAEPVLKKLNELNLNLSAILITHHHWDHTGGIERLLQHYDVPIYGPNNPQIKSITHPMKEKDRLHLPQLNVSFDILEIPGHTLDHIAYVGAGVVFCGDTLFSAGCGRLFEGTAKQMYHSLQRLAQLPADTLMYCAHEYTLANLKFAATVEPDNLEIEQQITKCAKLRHKNLPTLPSVLYSELQTNPFLRCEQFPVKFAAQAYAGKSIQTPIELFTILRDWKNKF